MVLDLESTCVDSIPTDLVYLRYFAAETRNLSIISSMTNCWNIETLLLNNWGTRHNAVVGEGRILPNTVWEMVKLRNLHVRNFTIENEKGLVDNSNKLDNLKTLSTPVFSCVQDAELFLSKTPNLRELKLRVEYIPELESCVLNFPTQIEKLQIYRLRFDHRSIPFFISAPNLKNLTLMEFDLDPQHLSQIGTLQNLQVLKLRYIFFSKGWEVRNEDFPLLKVLKLKGITFEEKWTVDEEAFPNLEYLVLRSCSFEEIPSCFGEMSSLKSIEVKYCKESICKSARDIREIQVEDYQNSGFELSIINERSKGGANR